MTANNKELIINKNSIHKLAGLYWSQKASTVDIDLIKRIYNDAVLCRVSLNILESTGYVEKYLWPHKSYFFDLNVKPAYDPAKPGFFEYIMSLMFLIVCKKQKVPQFWDTFELESSGRYFGHLIEAIISIISSRLIEDRRHDNKMPRLNIDEENAFLNFLITLSSSIEIDEIRSALMRSLSMTMWENIDEKRFEAYFAKYPKIKAFWGQYLINVPYEELKDGQILFWALIEIFFRRLFSFEEEVNAEDSSDLKEKEIRNLELTLELLSDLLSQIPTRKYLRFFLIECHFLTICKTSNLAKTAINLKRKTSFLELLADFEHFLNFQIDDETGEFLTDKAIETQHNIDLALFQKLAFKNFGEALRSFALSTLSVIEIPEKLKKFLSALSDSQLRDLCLMLRLLPISINILEEKFAGDREFMCEIIINTYAKRRKSIFKSINELALYPTEKLLWNRNFLPSSSGKDSSSRRLALPKLNLQFLTLGDYLARCFELYRLETTYQIREDLAEILFNLRPEIREFNLDRKNKKKETVFMGYSRMAVPIRKVTMTKLGEPHLGSSKPSVVKYEIEVDLRPFISTRNQKVFNEWEELRRHDILFLCTIDAKIAKNETKRQNHIDNETLGLRIFRGCEIVDVKDEDYCLIGERDDEGVPHSARGTVRTFCVELDSAQYEKDSLEWGVPEDGNIYKDFNLMVRKKSKENNFKAILATIRNLMNKKIVLPDWIKEILIGYGDPKSINPPNTSEMNYVDTFIDIRHIAESFPSYKISAEGLKTDDENLFNLTFNESDKTISVRQSESGLRMNQIRFTKMQIKSIKSGMQKGLTLIVGPPGTGKTDVAVQIINNLIVGKPSERILLITHSNAALNDLFEKIVKSNIDEKFLLRLGYGYKELETEENFGRDGRVQHIFRLREELLEKLGRLFKSINLGDGTGFTCENALNLFSYHITARWESFVKLFKEKTDDETNNKPSFKPSLKISEEKSPKRPREDQKDEENPNKKVKITTGEAAKTTTTVTSAPFVSENFPFRDFFEEEKGLEKKSLFQSSKSESEAFNKAESLFGELKVLEKCAKEFVPFEVLRTLKDRGDYLAASYSKIVAMTCTHAALKHGDLLDLNFEFDTLVMEEAAQMLDIEAFVSIALQNNKKLKRLVLIGDHRQLPPVVQCQALRDHSHLDQSLFARLARLRVNTLQLDLQGRSRPEIARLFSWRYPQLRDLPQTAELSTPIAGMAFPFQFINVPDYNGYGESSPTPHFIQNLGEAEFIVALYQFLRLRGHRRDQISLLAAYEGQRQLIRDIIRKRCANDKTLCKLFGNPRKISTIDKFQGRQSDIVLLSLVRTRSPGHLRDIRRIIVALSRARKGLFVFGRRSLLGNIHECTEAMKRLTSNGDKLVLVRNEVCGSEMTQNRSKERLIINGIDQLGKIVTAETCKALMSEHNQWVDQMKTYSERCEEKRKGEEQK